MNEPPVTFQFGGLLCLPQQAYSNTYCYVPLHADLARGPDGRPSFNLIQAGATGYLMLTAVWKARDAAVDALRRELAARQNIERPEDISLSPAPVDVTRCDLLLGDGAGTFQTIATNSTSRFPPYGAVFSVSLTREQLAQAAAAVNGRAGFLAVEYDATLPTRTASSARLTPQSTRLVQWLREAGGNDEQSFRSALEEAIQDGLAIVSVDLPDNPGTTLVATLYERLLSRAAAVLPRMIASREENGIEKLEVSVDLVEETREPMHPRLDLATVTFDPSHVMIAPQRSSERGSEVSRPLRVNLGFDPTGAPLAWVRVRSAGSEVVLTAPQFHAAELSGDWRVNPLTITAGFNNGVHNHTVDIASPAGSDFSFTPEHLGLRALSVDGAPLSAAGMERAEVTLRYRPPHPSDEQRAIITFRDGAWTSRWWVVARTSSWLRYVEFSWKAVAPDGRVVAGSTGVPRSPQIVLSVNEGSSHAAD